MKEGETTMSNIQPWCVASWPAVAWPVNERHLIIRALRYESRVEEPLPGVKGLRRGQVLWSCETGHGPAGLAWDWVELRPGVVAMADPMCVLSNLQFIDAQGQRLPAPTRLLELNNLIASLPWQRAFELQPPAFAAPLPLAA